MLFQKNDLEECQKPQAYWYAICLKSDSIPIGYVHVGLDDSHNLGYGLRKEFLRNEMVGEAGTAVLDQVKRDGILYVAAEKYPGNLPVVPTQF